VLFYVNEQGQVVVDQVHIIDPEQAWFWTERWQKMEREVDEDIAAGNLLEFENAEDFIKYLHDEAETEDAKN
jgi:antitoxin MazE